MSLESLSNTRWLERRLRAAFRRRFGAPENRLMITHFGDRKVRVEDDILGGAWAEYDYAGWRLRLIRAKEDA